MIKLVEKKYIECCLNQYEGSTSMSSEIIVFTNDKKQFEAVLQEDQLFREYVGADEDIWLNARGIFNSHPEVKYIPVIKEDKIVCFCTNDEVDEKAFQIVWKSLKTNESVFLEIVRTAYGCVRLDDMNELTYAVFNCLINANIPVCLIGQFWELLNIENVTTTVAGPPLKLDNKTCCDIVWHIMMHCLQESAPALRNKENYAANLVCTKFVNDGFSSIAYEDLCALDSLNFSTFITTVSRTFNRKISMIYGNCHMDVVRKYLFRSSEYLSEYITFVFPPIYDIEKSNIGNIDESFLQEIDLLIYQRIERTNQFGVKWNTEDMIQKLKQGCRTVSVPNTIFYGYFPQEGHRSNTILKNQKNFRPMFTGDKFIEREFYKTGSISETIGNIKKKDYLSASVIEKNLRKSIRMLELQDDWCDVKMSDYILENYKYVFLFTEPKHPINIFFKEMTNRILKYIEINDFCSACEELDKEDSLATISRLLYPAVKENLGLTFEVYDYYCDKRITRQKLSFDEYVELYIRNVCDIEKVIKEKKI